MTPETHQTTSRPASDNIWEHSIAAYDSNFVLAQCCMWYLRLKELYTRHFDSHSNIDKLVSEYNFLDYSARNWALRFRASSMPDRCTLKNLASDLCKTQEDQYMSWEIVYWDNFFNDRLGLSLCLASHLGLSEVVFQLLAAPGVEVNRANTDGKTPLSLLLPEGTTMWSASWSRLPVLRSTRSMKTATRRSRWLLSKGTALTATASRYRCFGQMRYFSRCSTDS